MRMRRKGWGVGFLTLLLLWSAGPGFAQEETAPLSVPESYTLKGVPVELGPKMEILHGNLIVEDQVPQVVVLRNEHAYTFLKYHRGQSYIGDLEEMYRDGDNPYRMPKMRVHATVSLEELGKYMGANLAGEFHRERKVKDGALFQPMEFFAVKFEKRGDDFVVTQWLPEFLFMRKIQMREPF